MHKAQSYNECMMPRPETLDTSPEFVNELCERIGKSREWIADNSGISRRRIQYLLAGYRVINGEKKPVELSYPEMFVLQTLAEAGERFNPRPASD